MKDAGGFYLFTCLFVCLCVFVCARQYMHRDGTLLIFTVRKTHLSMIIEVTAVFTELCEDCLLVAGESLSFV